jgi:hypothetical protein
MPEHESNDNGPGFDADAPRVYLYAVGPPSAGKSWPVTAGARPRPSLWSLLADAIRTWWRSASTPGWWT